MYLEIALSFQGTSLDKARNNLCEQYTNWWLAWTDMFVKAGTIPPATTIETHYQAVFDVGSGTIVHFLVMFIYV